MLSAIVGPMGSGKTCLLTYLLLKDCAERGRDIFANYALDFGPRHAGKIHRLDLVKMLDHTNTELSHASLAIDEAHVFFDSRASASKMNRLISQVLVQTRKRDVDVYVTAQVFKQVDVRFRQNCDYVVLTAMRSDRIFARIFNRQRGKWSKLVLEAKPLYELYDTNQLIDPTRVSDAVDEMAARRRARIKVLEQEERRRLRREIREGGHISSTDPDGAAPGPASGARHSWVA